MHPLSPELIQKYTEQFKTPERFMQINGNIVVLPVPAEKQDLAYLPDRFETGERVQTPRGQLSGDGYEPGTDGGGRLRRPPYFR